MVVYSLAPLYFQVLTRKKYWVRQPFYSPYPTGLPAATTTTVEAVSKPPESAISVRSSVNLRKESVKLTQDTNGQRRISFSFDSLEPCRLKLKFKAPYVFSKVHSSCRNEHLNSVPTLHPAELSQRYEIPIDLSAIKFPEENDSSEEADPKQRAGAIFSLVLKSGVSPGAGYIAMCSSNKHEASIMVTMIFVHK